MPSLQCDRRSPAADLGVGMPLVALVLQWRQDYPDNRPPTRATAISAMGQNRPPSALPRALAIGVSFVKELATNWSHRSARCFSQIFLHKVRDLLSGHLGLRSFGKPRGEIVWHTFVDPEPN